MFAKLLAEAQIESFNSAQGRILYILWQADRVPIVELSQKTGLAKSTLTSMLDRMENSGLVYRISDKADRRQVRIGLTEQAKRLNDEYQLVSARMNDLFYRGFSDDEIVVFEGSLRKILANLEAQEQNDSKGDSPHD